MNRNGSMDAAVRTWQKLRDNQFYEQTRRDGCSVLHNDCIASHEVEATVPYI
jgi:hypothetical protein